MDGGQMETVMEMEKYKKMETKNENKIEKKGRQEEYGEPAEKAVQTSLHRQVAPTELLLQVSL